MVTDGLGAWAAGTPLVLSDRGVNVYGRLERSDGGVVYMRTPGGTLLHAGFIWFRRAEGEDLEHLRHYEELAEYKGRWYAHPLRTIQGGL